MKFSARFSVLGLALLAAAASFSPAQAQDKIVTVFAAASMKNALDDVAKAYTDSTKIKVTSSYAASSALAKQIESGAPADMFISADTDWMDYVAKKELIKAGTRVDLLGNKIVLIAPKDSKTDKVDIKQGFDLAGLVGDSKIATGDVAAVPVGKYAKAALEKLGAWDKAAPKFAMAENVRRSPIRLRSSKTPRRIRRACSTSCARRRPRPCSRSTASPISSRRSRCRSRCKPHSPTCVTRVRSPPRRMDCDLPLAEDCQRGDACRAALRGADRLAAGA